jgi:hypothetical protein
MLANFVEHPAIQIILTIFTIYSLFFDDIRIIACPPSADPAFYSLTLVVFSAFMVEILLASIAIEDYFLSFFFWLDLISTLSMLADVGWIFSSLSSQGTTLRSASTS